MLPFNPFGFKANMPSMTNPIWLTEEYATRRISLSPSDCVVLYTDGVTEARRDGELFGEGRLLQALCDAPDRHPQTLVDHLRDAVTSHAEELKDDLQILALRRNVV